MAVGFGPMLSVFPCERTTSMGLVHQKYKVAVVQAGPVFLDLDAPVDKTIALIEQGAAQGAKLIAFPETFIPGYPWQIWLGAPAWAIGRGFVQRYFDNSLSYDSPQAEKIRKAVKRAKLTAVIGLSERDGGSLYMGQWLIGPDGETIAKRRKLRPTHAERTVFGEGDGSDLAVHDRADVGRLGSSLTENLPPDQEGILYADIDLGMIGVAKNAADPAGHYSRPDVTRLLLNTSRANRVEHFTLPVDAEVMSEIKLQA